MLTKLLFRFLDADKRKVLIRKNIIGSIALKTVSLFSDFLIVPLSLAFLTETNYGIWITINSVVNWFNLFDVGISHGFRNKLAIALSNNNLEEARKLNSTVYISVSFISIILILLNVIIVPLIDWKLMLNCTTILNKELVFIVQAVFLCFSINLCLKNLIYIFLADQLPVFRDLYLTSAKVLSTLGLVIIVSLTKENLLLYVLVCSIAPLVVIVIFHFLFYSKKYAHLRPSFKMYRNKLNKDIFGLGFKFFILQLGAAILFLTDNLIISHIYSPELVPSYEISRKYFGVMIVIFSVFVTPYWSAITDAFENKEFEWIKTSINSLIRIWIITSLGSFILLLLFYPILEFWVGDNIDVPISLAVQSVIFIILLNINSVYTYFLNGVSKINIQILTQIITIIINIPLSIFFAKTLALGMSGVLLATNCSLLMYVIIRKIQYEKIINNRAYGIWNK